jgi:hypothetical protein
LANPELISLKLGHIIKEKLNPQRIVLSNKLKAVEGILYEYKTYQTDPNCLEGKFAKFRFRHVEQLKQGVPLDALLTDAINSEYSTESSIFDG